MGRLTVPTEYEQGYADGTQAAERAAMELVTILVKRLGGRVEISDCEIMNAEWRELHWHFDKSEKFTVYEVK